MSTGAPNARSTSRQRPTRSASDASDRAGPPTWSPGVNSTTVRLALSIDDRVRRHEARHHRLAQPGCRVDQDLVGPSGDRMTGEGDGRGQGRARAPGRRPPSRHRRGPVRDGSGSRSPGRSRATPSSAARPARPRPRSARAPCRATRRTRRSCRPRRRRTSGPRAGADGPCRLRARARAGRARRAVRRDRRRQRTGDHGGDERGAGRRVAQHCRGVSGQPGAPRQGRDLCREGIGGEAEPGRDPEPEPGQPVERGGLPADPPDVRATAVEPFDEGVHRVGRDGHRASLARRPTPDGRLAFAGGEAGSQPNGWVSPGTWSQPRMRSASIKCSAPSLA